MALEELLSLRGTQLARAYMREVLRLEGEPPPAREYYNQRGQELYDGEWAFASWLKVRRRYEALAEKHGLPEFSCTMLTPGHNPKVPMVGVHMYFKGEPDVEWQVLSDNGTNNDLSLLSAIHLYIRLVRAGVVKPRENDG